VKMKSKTQVWLNRAAEQYFCKVHPNVIGIDEAGKLRMFPLNMIYTSDLN
jgi:hypothetical protein